MIIATTTSTFGTVDPFIVLVLLDSKPSSRGRFQFSDARGPSKKINAPGLARAS
jgi:hypothetical protein